MKIECKTHGNVCWKIEKEIYGRYKNAFSSDKHTHTFECLLFRIIFEFYFKYCCKGKCFDSSTVLL